MPELTTVYNTEATAAVARSAPAVLCCCHCSDDGKLPQVLNSNHEGHASCCWWQLVSVLEEEFHCEVAIGKLPAGLALASDTKTLEAPDPNPEPKPLS